MAKFNLLKRREREAINHMGAKAYQYDERFELVSTLLTSFVEDAYYRKSTDTVARLVELIKALPDKAFAARATLFARNDFNMRSVTHVMAAELAPYLSGQPYATRFYEKVAARPDDMLEIAAYQLAKENGKLSNAMRRGFRRAFGKFDAYQLAKYRGEQKTVKLVDLANLLHPRATERNGNALDQLVGGTLRNRETWESQLTRAGQEADKEAARRESWEALILNSKIGYMALLRNLRNILQAGVSEEALDKALRYLSDEKAVQNSKQFPFRFLSAYQEIASLKKGGQESSLVFEKDRVNPIRITKVLGALEAAINTAVRNLPLLEGETVILSDNSGSMRGDYGGSSALSAMSKRTTADIANLFAAMYWARCDNTLIGLFGDRLITPQLDRRGGLFENFNTLHQKGAECGPATETGIFTMFERLIREKRQVARIVIFSDMQIGTGCSWYDTGKRRGADFNALYKRYRAINPAVKVYSVDLRGYGTTVFKAGEYKIAGWSEKIFDIMEILEQDQQALVHRIEAVEL